MQLPNKSSLFEGDTRPFTPESWECGQPVTDKNQIFKDNLDKLKNFNCCHLYSPNSLNNPLISILNVSSSSFSI